jgi:superfamily II DNA or RNA helicase
MKVRLPKLDPELAYITSSLFLPKKHIEEGPVRSALTFGMDEDGNARVLLRTHPHHLEVPRSFLTAAQIEALDIEVIDLRPRNYRQVTITPKDWFSFREHQVPAWDVMKDVDDGVLVLACGKGKTLMGWYKAADNGGPILFISWQKAHLGSAEEELKRFFDFDGTIGWIGDGKMEWDRDVVFCTVQTLSGKVLRGGLPPGFASHFATVIFDEAHHMSAQYFSNGADVALGARIGLTATDRRVDRLEGIYFTHLGPVFYRDLSQDLEPIFWIVDTNVDPTQEDEKEFLDVTGQRNIPKIRSWLGSNPDRNAVIRGVLDHVLNLGRTPYGLSHAVDQVEWFHAQYPDSGCITGKVKKHDERLRQLNDFTPVFATMQIGSEAYNRKDLDTLLLMTPFAASDYASPAFQQSVGRIQRASPGKGVPWVFLFMDSSIEESKGMTFSLIKEAKRQGYEVRQWQTSRSHRPLKRGA